MRLYEQGQAGAKWYNRRPTAPRSLRADIPSPLERKRIALLCSYKACVWGTARVTIHAAPEIKGKALRNCPEMWPLGDLPILRRSHCPDPMGSHS